MKPMKHVDLEERLACTLAARDGLEAVVDRTADDQAVAILSRAWEALSERVDYLRELVALRRGRA